MPAEMQKQLFSGRKIVFGCLLPLHSWRFRQTEAAESQNQLISRKKNCVWLLVDRGSGGQKQFLSETKAAFSCLQLIHEEAGGKGSASSKTSFLGKENCFWIFTTHSINNLIVFGRSQFPLSIIGLAKKGICMSKTSFLGQKKSCCWMFTIITAPFIEICVGKGMQGQKQRFSEKQRVVFGCLAPFTIMKHWVDKCSGRSIMTVATAINTLSNAT